VTAGRTLVVRYRMAQLRSKCVCISEPTITGEELLQRSGLDRGHGLQRADRRRVFEHPKDLGWLGAGLLLPMPGRDWPVLGLLPWTEGGWLYSQLGAAAIRSERFSGGGTWGRGNFSSGRSLPAVNSEEYALQSLATSPAPDSGTGTLLPHGWVRGLRPIAAVALLGAGVLVTRPRQAEAMSDTDVGDAWITCEGFHPIAGCAGLVAADLARPVDAQPALICAWSSWQQA